MSKQTKLFLSVIGTIVVLAVIFYYFDTQRIISIISKMNPTYFVLAIIAYVFVNLAMSKRIQMLLSEMKCEKITLIETLKANFGGMLASDFTPARSGYFLTAFMISSEKKIDLDKTMVSIFAPQLLEFAIKIISTAILALLILNRLGGAGNFGLYVFLSLVIFGATITFFGALLFAKGLLEKFSFAKGLPLVGKGYYLFWLMRENSVVILHRWKEVLGYTLAGLIFKSVEWYLIAIALGISIFHDPALDFGFFLLFQSFLTLTHFLPLPTVAGAGAAEATSAAVFVLLGISVENGIAFSIMTRTLMIIVDLIGLTAIIPLFHKESLENILSDIESIEKRSKTFEPSILASQAVDFGPGTENLSEKIDDVLYANNQNVEPKRNKKG